VLGPPAPVRLKSPAPCDEAVGPRQRPPSPRSIFSPPPCVLDPGFSFLPPAPGWVSFARLITSVFSYSKPRPFGWAYLPISLWLLETAYVLRYSSHFYDPWSKPFSRTCGPIGPLASSDGSPHVFPAQASSNRAPVVPRRKAFIAVFRLTGDIAPTQGNHAGGAPSTKEHPEFS